MPIIVGSVGVEVTPNVQTFSKKIRAALLPVADDVGKEMGKRIADRIGDQMPQAGVKSGGDFADTFKNRVDAALQNLPDAKVSLEDTDAQAKLNDIRERLRALSGVRVGVDIDTGDALELLEAVKLKAQELGRESPDIAIKVDSARAVAQIAAVTAEIDALNKTAGDLDGKKKKTKTPDDGLGIAAPGLGTVLAGLTPILAEIGTVGLGGILAVGGGFLTAGAGAAAFGAVAEPVLTATLRQQTALTAAQAAYSKAQAQLEAATTKSQRAAALKAESVALLAQQAITSKMTSDQVTFLGLLNQTKTAYQQVQTAVSPDIFEVANQALADAPPLISALGPVAQSVTPALLSLETSFGRAVSGIGFQQFKVFVQDEAPTAITDLGQTAGNLGAVIAHAVEAVAPLTNEALGSLESLTGKLASANLGPGSGFGKFIGYAEANGPAVARTFGDIVDAAARLVGAVAPLGPPLLSLADALTHVVDDAAPTVSLIAHGLTPAVKGLADVLHDLAPELGPEAVGVGVLFAAFKGYQLVEKATTAIKAFTVADAASNAVSTGGGSGLTGIIGKLSRGGGVAEDAAGAAGAGAAAEGGIGASGLLAAIGGPATLGLGAVAVGLGTSIAAIINSERQAQAKQQAAGLATITKAFLPAVNNPSIASLIDAQGATQSTLAGSYAKIPAFDGRTNVKASQTYNAETAAVSKDSAAIRTMIDNTQALGQQTGLTSAKVTTLANNTGINLAGSLSDISNKFATLSLFQGDNYTQLQLLSTAYDLFNKTGSSTSDQVNALNDEFAAFDVQAANVQALDAYQSALRSTATELKSNHAGLSSDSAAAGQNREAILSAASALNAHVVALKQAGAPLAAVNVAYSKGYASVAALARSTGDAAGATALLNKVLPAPARFDGLDQSLAGIAGQAEQAAIKVNDIVAAIKTLEGVGGGKLSYVAAAGIAGANEHLYGIAAQHRAAGGPVSAGSIYKVNELGTEYFAPNVSGHIFPAGSVPLSMAQSPRISTASLSSNGTAPAGLAGRTGPLIGNATFTDKIDVQTALKLLDFGLATA